MLVTPFEHAARAPVRAQTRPGLFFKIPCEVPVPPGGVFSTLRVQDSSVQSVLACRSQLVHAANSARPLYSRFGFILISL